MLNVTEEEDFAQTASSSPFGTWSRRGLDPIKLAYNRSRSDGQL